MARHRSIIEKRFRRGSNGFLLIAALAAAASSALYYGLDFYPVRAFCLATPMVLESLARHAPDRLYGAQVRYYVYVFGLALAGVLGLLGLLSRASSHTGGFFKVSNQMLRSFARVGAWFGIANLVGSRLIYFTGIVLYTLDGVAAVVLENAIPRPIADLHLLVLMNLAVHLFLLSYLLFGFVAGFERELPAHRRD